jgi:hypothetical protein
MEVDGIHIEQLAIPNSTIHVVRAVGTLKNIDIEKLFKAGEEGGLEERKKINNDIIVSIHHSVTFLRILLPTKYLTLQ